MKYITISDYSGKTGMKIGTITKRIRNNNALSGISKIEKVGRFYLLFPKRGISL